jgi:hypothetical protein
MKTLRTRYTALAAGAALALLAAAGLYKTMAPAGAEVAPSGVALGPHLPQATMPQGDAQASSLRRQPWTAAGTDPFRPVSFVPPPSAPVVAQAVPAAVVEKPVAPPFPYQFFGWMIAVDGKTLTYLIREGSLLQVQAGEVIDGAYRIDAASDTQLQVTYLPLNEQSTLVLQTAAQ